MIDAGTKDRGLTYAAAGDPDGTAVVPGALDSGAFRVDGPRPAGYSTPACSMTASHLPRISVATAKGSPST